MNSLIQVQDWNFKLCKLDTIQSSIKYKMNIKGSKMNMMDIMTILSTVTSELS